MITSQNSRQIILTLSLLFLSFQVQATKAQTGQPSHRSAVVVDERLAALRTAPDLRAALVRRLSRGRRVTIVGSRRSGDGTLFNRVAVTRRTRGWIQHEALVSPRRGGDDERLLRLIEASRDFDRLARARIFLDAFPRSSLRPKVLLIFGDEANKAAQKLSQDAARRLNREEMSATGASLTSYYLNYSGLDRYRRQGVVFSFDEDTRQFHYDGAAWQEKTGAGGRSRRQ
ncbi:MAG TPA: hypothetical protein VJS64_12155 [Pyrinomonadaceae bacterium]|nr:hypothetical protein [Pyrinomonadaceae bacterium]